MNINLNREDRMIPLSLTMKYLIILTVAWKNYVEEQPELRVEIEARI